MVRIALILLVCLATTVFVNHYIPLQAAVIALYLGLGAMAVAAVSLVKPLRFLGIRRRAVAAVLLAIGVAVAIAAISWTAPMIHASGPHQRLDDFMASYSFYERHETRVKATPQQVARAVREVRFSDIPVATLLMRIRGMASGRFSAPPPSTRPILAVMSGPGSGFLVLDAGRPDEYVGGMVGRPWASGPPPHVATPEGFLAFSTPGYVKVAFNIRWVDEGNGYVRVSTETRCIGTDAESRKVFGRYWRVIYPGSAIIRRAWLDAIVTLAEGG
ncbi:MAG: hypothetical protein LUQ59_11760 [Methanothrix sp.]|nr:hypothetical protein [Methanothrix sp.]